MDLEPNFPSVIPATEDELTQVLVEFYQRGQGEVKALPPPPPFEVTSSVVQSQARRTEPLPSHDDPLVIQPQALVRPETEFDFEFTYLTGNAGGFPIVLQWWWRCHNDGAIANESYIRVYPGFYWESINPPGYRGSINMWFNGSTWTPPGHNEQGVYIQLSMWPLNFPIGTPGHHINIYEARMYNALYIQGVNSPYTVSDHIYQFGQLDPAAITFYQATNGLGFIITFHGDIQ